MKKRELNDKTFCPVSSILDASKTSGCNSLRARKTEGNPPVEYGDMCFQFFSENPNIPFQYGGIVIETIENKNAIDFFKIDLKLILKNPDENGSDGEEINIKSENNLFFENEDRCAINGDYLSVQNIYQKIISKVAFYINNYNFEKIQHLYNNTWKELYGIMLLKNCGDFLQELNSILNFGGYYGNKVNYSDIVYDKNGVEYEIIKNETIINWDQETGNSLRLGIQNDQPSSVRSMFLSLSDSPNINQMAITGFVSKTTSILTNKNKIINYSLGNDDEEDEEVQEEENDELQRQYSTQSQSGEETKINTGGRDYNKNKVKTIKKRNIRKTNILNKNIKTFKQTDHIVKIIQKK